MASVEGMWKFQSGSVQEPDVLRWGGIVVLESCRIFGGDSVMAYVGRYDVDRENITARVRSWTWNFDVGESSNVFGMEGAVDYIAIFEGARDGDVITGTIAPESSPDIKLQCRMEKIAELP